MRFSVVADARCDTMWRMSRRRIGFVLVAIAILCAATPPSQARAAARNSLAAKLRTHRTSPTDLEIGGDVRGLAAGTTRYLTRDDLLAASLAMTISPDDGNFKTTSQVRGVLLEDLVHALGAAASDMVVAICKDKYRGHYSRAYLSAHHPFLVMELDGKPLPGSTETEADDPGPYLIAHVSFPRTSRDPVENDEPQIPWGVVRLDFRDEETVLDSIKPRIANLQKAVGYGIAEQNCFRCHNNGAEGGLKSGVTWTVLAALAANSPQFFTEYVRDPKAKNPKTQMAASPAYDDATMRALIAYFRTFAPISPEAR